MPETKDLKLFDENEQLRTALESSLEENGRVVEDRDRLLKRITVLARELQDLNAARHSPPASVAAPAEQVKEFVQSQTEEELRVAFEELQVMAEELEVANSNLEQANRDLDMRVQARTRDLAAANAELRRTQGRLSTLVEGIPQLVWRAADGGDWTWCSSQWTAFTGQSEEESRHKGWLETIDPDDRQAALDAWDHAEAQGDLSYEGRICERGGRRSRFFQTRATPVRSPGGAIVEWLGTCTDIDTIIQLQEQQTVLVGELQHRTRNLMAVVQAVMMRTLRSSGSLEEFRRCIDERMSALARVQGLLSRRGGNRVAFDQLLREELAAHVDLDSAGAGAQVSLDGPAGVSLESSLVQTFALALHELATNAVKYGALATAEGRLRVQWSVLASDAERDRLHVDWRETGVTDLPAPDDKPRGGGYGRELIERALPYQLGAKTTYSFAGDGIHCTIEVDVPPDKARREGEYVRSSA